MGILVNSKELGTNLLPVFQKLVEKEKGSSVKCLRTDRGGEFTDFCKENGIKR